MPLISIIVPCYNEQESLPIFLKELDNVVHTIAQDDPSVSFEAILIDDGSAALIRNFIRTLPTFIRTCTDECGNPIP